MAEGEWGVGRMAEPAEIAARVEQLLAPGPLAGRRVLVTAGGTREPLDSVRFVGNRSSGPHGRRARGGGAPPRRGGRCCSPRTSPVAAPTGVEAIPTPTAESMLDAALALAGRRRRAARRGRRRLPAGRGARRQAAEGRPRLDGRARADAGHRARARRAQAPGPGARRLRRRASARRASSASAAMLETKNADLVVFNDVGRADIGFDAADNEVVLVSRDGERTVAEGPEGRDRGARSSTRSRRCWPPSDASSHEGGSDGAARHPAQTSRAREHASAIRGAGDERRLRASSARASSGSASGMTAQATVPLEKAKRLEPDKASIREALGIAYFRLARWQEAETRVPRDRRGARRRPTTTRTTRSAARSSSRAARPRRTATTSSRARWSRAPRRTPRASCDLDERGEGGRPARRARGGDARRRDRGGLCVLLGVAAGDDGRATPSRLAGKIARLRIFEDEAGKFDRSLLDTGGAALVVSQFTLIADTRKGNRPSFSGAARPEVAEPLYELFCAALRGLGVPVETGVFGARMSSSSRTTGRSRSSCDDRRSRLVLLPCRSTFRARSKWARGAHFLMEAGTKVASATTYQGESSCTARVARTVESALPGVEVLALELTGQGALLRLRRPPGGCRPRALRARDGRAATVSRRLLGRGVVARASTGRCARARTSSARSGRQVRVEDRDDGRGSAARSSSAGERPCRSEPARGRAPVDIPYDAIVRANLIDEG